MTAALWAAWSVWVVGGLARLRDGTRSRSPVQVIGSAGIGAIGGGLRRAAGCPPDASRDRRWGGVAVATAVAGLLAPLLAPAVLVVAAAGPRFAAARAHQRRERLVAFELPEVVDLFRLGASAGLTIAESARLVATSSVGPIAVGFAEAVRRIDRGGRLGESLESVLSAGEPVRPLVRVLVGAERYGLALDPALAEVALLARQDRRRRIEVAARRVSVRLLLPLVLCVLPAFVVLTIVPSLVGSIGRLTDR